MGELIGKKKKKAAVIFLVLILTSILGIISFLYREYLYNLYFAEPEEILKATGTIEATTVDLSARLAGTLESIRVKDGDLVTEGQLVATLLRNDLVAQWERDAMTVLMAEAQLANLKAGFREAEKEEALAAVNIARANLEKAMADYKRAEALFEGGVIPAEDLETAQTNLEIKENQLKAAEARLTLMEEGNRPDLIDAAQAEVKRSKAILKASEAMLEDLKIYSPIQGTILCKNYEEGEFVPMGASVVKVADLDNLKIKVYIPTDDLPRIKLGQKVYFTVSGIETVFKGIVDKIASEGEFTPKSIQTPRERANVVYAVEIKTDSANGVLKPGMPADIVFEDFEGDAGD